MRARKSSAVLLVIAALAGGCGGDGGDGDGEVVIEGHLIAVDGQAPILCLGAIQESAPPGCGGESLRIVGIGDPLDIQGVERFMGWSSGDVALRGTVDDAVLTVSG